MRLRGGSRYTRQIRSRIQTRMQCPEYEKLWAAYIDAACEWRDTVQRPSLSIYSIRFRSRATVLKDSARERAAAHKRNCLLCANSKPSVSSTPPGGA